MDKMTENNFTPLSLEEIERVANKNPKEWFTLMVERTELEPLLRMTREWHEMKAENERLENALEFAHLSPEEL